MARVTLRLPDSLHDTLAQRAKGEGVSMNQYLVYALTQATVGQFVAAGTGMPESSSSANIAPVAEQRARFEEMRNRFSPAEAEAALQALLNART